jgi:nucleotide-binding universal stress UspA family protein
VALNRILLAVDGSPSAGPALSFTAGLAAGHGATAYVLHVNQYLVGGRGHTVITERAAAELVGRAVDQLRELGIDVVGFTRRATAFDVHRVIIDTARATDADAIVMGSNRRRGWLRLRGHGLRERVARSSPYPVLAAPAPLEVPRELPDALGAPRPAVRIGHRR